MLKKHTVPLVSVLFFLNGVAHAAPVLPIESANEYFIFQGKKIPLLRKSDQVAVWYKNIESPPASSFQSKWHANRTGNFKSNRERMEMYSLPGPANELDNVGKKNADLKFADFQIDLRNNPATREIGPVYYDPEFKRTVVCSDRILLRVSRPEILQEVLKTYPVELLEGMKLSRTYALKTRMGTLEIANRIAQHPGVEWAEPEFLGQIEPTRIPNDPMFPEAWHLNGNGGRGLMASLAWDIGWGDEKIVVGIFDDGGDSKGHPDLRLSPSGMNWTTTPYSKPPWTISSAAHHGTACAGAVGAIGDNNIGVVGVAPGVTILPMKITNYPESGFAWDRSMADAILYAADSAQVGSISVIGFESNYIRDAIKEAAINGRKGKGFLFFTSSGNGGLSTITTPSLYEYSICVGASTYMDLKASYSQWGDTGKTVEFLAPSGIPTTYLDATGPTYYTGFGGTSAATPVAAGVAALILSTNPDLTRTQVLDIMRSTCDKIGDVTYDAKGFNRQCGYGRLNAFSALKKVPPYIVMEPRDTTVSLGSMFSASITARGFEITYQWQKAISGSGWQTLSGETNTVFALNAVSATQAGRYRFLVKNANGSDTSRSFVLSTSGELSARDVYGPRSLQMKISRESGRIRCDVQLPASGPARLEILSPNGKSRMLLNQKLDAGVYTLYYPYRQVYSGPYLYRLTQGASVKTGKFQ